MWSSFCHLVNGSQLANYYPYSSRIISRRKKRRNHVIPVPVMYVVLSEQLASCGSRLFQPHRYLGRGPKPVQEPDWWSLSRSSILTWCQHWARTHSLTKRSFRRTLGGALFLRWEERLKHILESLIITNISVPQAGTFIEDLRSLIANRSSVSYINLTSAIDCWVDPCV